MLPMAQYAYNNCENKTIGITPFFANYGRHPQLPWKEISKESKSEKAILLGDEIAKQHKNLSKEILFMTHKMAYYYNRGRLYKNLKKGERVYLLRRHINKENFNIETKRPNEKLDFIKLGPFLIEEKCENDNYKLKLPKSMQIYPIIHISLLEPTENLAAEEDLNI